MPYSGSQRHAPILVVGIRRDRVAGQEARRHVDQVRRICRLEAAEERLLCSRQRPIVLLRKYQPSPIAEAVAMLCCCVMLIGMQTAYRMRWLQDQSQGRMGRGMLRTHIDNEFVRIEKCSAFAEIKVPGEGRGRIGHWPLSIPRLICTHS
jgi:hypothetical protein